MSNIENNQNKSNKRGGVRAGSGRKKGAATKRTREIADKAAESGLTPLEVMLDAMKEAHEAKDKKQAAYFAQMAAPYVHPKLSSVEMDAKITTKTLAQELAELNAQSNARGD